jgi:hypothetical protein
VRRSITAFVDGFAAGTLARQLHSLFAQPDLLD